MAPAADAIINVDGYLHSDWGVTPAGFTGATDNSDWVPDNGALYVVENQRGGMGTYLNPGYGGQKFDAEAMYYIRENGNIDVAIVTGHPVGGTSGYYPGDIFFDFGAGMQYGLETTGISAGKVYRNPLWNSSPYWGGVTDPTTMQNGSWLEMGLADFVYLNTYPGSGDADHWVMEMSIPETFFGSDWRNGGTVHWTETCGNDAIDLQIPQTTTPEPASVALFGLGLLGFGVRIKREISAIGPQASDIS